MIPTWKFRFDITPPSISQILELIKVKLGVRLDIRISEMKDPQAVIKERHGIDFGPLPPIITYHLSTENISYEVDLSTLNREGDIVVRVRTPQLTYFEGVVLLSVFELGGWIGRKGPRKSDISSSFKKEIPDFAYYPYSEAIKMKGFIL